MSRPTQRKIWMSLAVVAVFAFAGGLLGGRVEAEPDRGDLRLRDFGRILALVEDNYVGDANSEELVESAIQGMLRRLDPHSNFLDKDAFTEMRDEQRGRFSGLGIQIAKRGVDKPLTIIAPIDGTPAASACLRAG
jgi:carboxyl-terminal processing protease